MKKTYRDDWRVIVTIAPRSISDFGFTGLGDIAGAVTSGPIEVAVAPRRLGDLGGVSMSDSLASSDIEGDYRRRCEELLAALLEKPHVREGRVACTEMHVCSHCDLSWEVLTAEEAADDSTNVDKHSVEGEPVCCEKAIDEFRAERGLPLLDEDVVAYRNPDRPDVLLCREHGMGWAGLRPLTSEDLPDGGVCTYGRPSESECGRDVLAETGGAA